VELAEGGDAMSMTPEEKRARYLDYQRKYREANKEKVNEQKRQCEKANKEKYAERRRKYRAANKEKVAQQRSQQYHANKEKMAERNLQYRKANKDRMAEVNRKWREANKEKISERGRQHRKANKEKHSELSRRRHRKKVFAKEDGLSYQAWLASLNNPASVIIAIANLQPDPGQTLAQLIHELSGYAMEVCEQIANPPVIEDAPTAQPIPQPDLF
jgi:hypothetical protein